MPWIRGDNLEASGSDSVAVYALVVQSSSTLLCERIVADRLHPPMKRMAATEVLTTVANPFEGEIVVSMLESAGIAADLRSPSAAGFFVEPMGGVGAGPVDVLVPREQLAEAAELLAQSQKGNDTQ